MWDQQLRIIWSRIKALERVVKNGRDWLSWDAAGAGVIGGGFRRACGFPVKNILQQVLRRNMSVCRHRIWMRQTLARRVFCGAGAGVYAAAVFSGHALSTGGVAGAAEDSLSIYGYLAHEMTADRALSSRRGRRWQPHGRPAVLTRKRHFWRWKVRCIRLMTDQNAKTRDVFGRFFEELFFFLQDAKGFVIIKTRTAGRWRWRIILIFYNISRI